MKLRKNICEDCCKGKRISELDEKVDIQGTEYIPFLEGGDNGKFSLGSLKDYLFKLIEEYLINNGIIREDWVQSEPAYKLLATLPELIADRACKDEFGNNINDTYLTREAVKEYIGSIYEDLFVNNPPQILDGFITVDMLSDAVLQLLNSGGAITNFPDDEDITVKDSKLKFKDKVYDPNNYSGIGRTILRKNMVDGVNVLTQEMISEPNQIYIIQYDYDLRGETITIPDNSILWYLGGSLNNGTITSNSEDPIVVWGQILGNINIDIDVVLLDVPANEEDITSKTGELKFADKSYDVANFSGLGRKYLRKHIIDNKNILLLDMINEPDTIYIILYDYDLNGQTINIPNGSILDFQGGSIDNGTINFPKGTYIRNLYKGTATIVGSPTYIDHLADEEDVTTENGILKFKDKEYSSSNFSGLGRKYLRKNIVNGKNILTQDMINSSNTIYIIQYDYDLNEETITIPEGCVLQFEGGSLSNGVITGNNTRIIAGLDNIFGLNTQIKGTWNVIDAYPEWFGAKGDKLTDDSESLQLIFNSFEFVCLTGYYTFSKTLTLNRTRIVRGSKYYYCNNTSILKFNSETDNTALILPNSGKPYYKFENICLFGTPVIEGALWKESTIAIDITQGSIININSCWLSGFEKGIISRFNSYYNSISNSRIEGFKLILENFSPNNFNIFNNRVSNFCEFIRGLSGDGPLNIYNNSFEVFSSYFILVFYFARQVNVYNNYFEPNRGELPPLFTDNNNGRYGGNILFYGQIYLLNSYGNEFQVNDCKGVYLLCDLKSFHSFNNRILILEKTNLDYYYQKNPYLEWDVKSLTDFYLNDIAYVGTAENYLYDKDYTPMSFIEANSSCNFYAVDPVTNKQIYNRSSRNNVRCLNGWEFSSNRPPSYYFIDNILYFAGEIDKGSSTTSNVVGVLQGVDSTGGQIFDYCYLKCIDDNYNQVVLKFTFETTELEVVSEFTGSKIILDGGIINYQR